MPEKRNRSFVTFEKCYLDKIDWYDSSEVYNDLVMLFENANKNLLKIGSALIKGNVSERTICAALMLHLSKSLKKTPFHKYFTDVEYNRNKNGIVKTIIDENEVITTITCDLIVHSRGSYTQQDNLIALEMKKSNRKKTEKQKDKNRLIALTKDGYSTWSYDGGVTLPEHVCRYILGIYYEINLNKHYIYLEYYRHGELLCSKKIVI